MSYQLNLDTIKEKFKFDSSLRHNPKTDLELLPYNTKFKDTQFNFREVIGEFIRLVGHKALPDAVDSDEVINNVLDQIEFEHVNQRSEFKQIVKTLFLDEHNQLYLFHPQTLYYINTVENENRKLALFLYNVLWNEEEAWNVDFSQDQSNDLMSELLFKSLPKLSSTSEQSKNYAAMIPEISNMFVEDFKWLVTKNELFTRQVEKIVAYYYFFYVTQFALRNESMFNASDRVIKPIYFTFEGEEKLSKTRVSYEFGWKSVERSITRTFSHINYLKMLNFSNDSKSKFLSYQEVAERVRSMSLEDQNRVEQDMNQLIEEYKNKLSGDSKWGLMGIVAAPYDVRALNKMYLFLNMIDHQFNQTSRSKPYKEYIQWFVYFCQKTFLKSRGRAGKMLILDTDYLLFFTKMIIKNEPKIRLKRLFEEFERRGIVFDRDTQTSVVDYFEKLNLLEKKSDSGDAIYVKAFL